uniref:Uncharacterized protein n=1 Tax=Anguilla anguilla TaxID=7936 RepID=A0A0E9TX07_ANGAN
MDVKCPGCYRSPLYSAMPRL